MAFADEAKSHAAFITDHVFGEAIGYRADPSPMWQTIRAVVQRRPVDAIGEVLMNSIHVLVAKGAVPRASVGKDEVKLLLDVPIGEQPPKYRVTEILQESPGSWSLRCTK